MRRLQYYINVEDDSGNVLGSGPITSALYWRQTKSMDQAGTFETSFPLADPAADNVDSEGVLRCYAVIPGEGPTEIGSGVVDNIAFEPSADGMLLHVSGLDEMRLLRDRSVGFLQLGGSGSPPTVSHSTAISSIEALAPSGWSFTADSSVPFDEIIYRFRGESILGALIKMAQFSKTHFYLDSAKSITFDSTFTSSGITCVNEPVQGFAQSDTTAFISQYSYVRETKDLMSRVYPYGGWYDGIFTNVFIPGVNDVNFGITASDPDYWASPKYTGYTDDRTNNYIIKDSTNTAWGRRERFVQYPDIKVTFVTGGYSNAIWRSLCRLIYNRAIADLDWYGLEAEFYQLQLQNCNTIIEPLQTVRLIMNVIEGGRKVFRVDDTLLVISSQIECTGAGIKTTNLEVTNAERYRRSDPYATVSFQNYHFNDQYS